MKKRLDRVLAERKLTETRSQAQSYIKLGTVKVNDEIVKQPAFLVGDDDKIIVNAEYQYVSRAALKLKSVSSNLGLNFKNTVVLDVGSSTGGFTDYALHNGAKYVIAIEVGTDQMHPKVRNNTSVELHEKTDIRDVKKLSQPVDVVAIDVSFISLREVLPSIIKLVGPGVKIIALFKPQFETKPDQKHKGVIKNAKIRRELMTDFELWAKQNGLVILGKADSKVHGGKGNEERVYYLQTAK
jgi:23S rRNA (cytidine1920-2'-O)/16S rRNA (cytidine1409-2'-O)-methyltransferase